MLLPTLKPFARGLHDASAARVSASLARNDAPPSDTRNRTSSLPYELTTVRSQPRRQSGHGTSCLVYHTMDGTSKLQFSYERLGIIRQICRLPLSPLRCTGFMIHNSNLCCFCRNDKTGIYVSSIAEKRPDPKVLDLPWSGELYSLDSGLLLFRQGARLLAFASGFLQERVFFRIVR